MPRASLLIGFLAVLLLGSSVRFHGLDIGWDYDPNDERALLYRPLHLDEAVQGRKLGRLLDEGIFQYNPKDLHGPGLIYSTIPLAWLRGETTGSSLTDRTLRLVPALYGVALLGLLWFWRRAMGGGALLAAGLLFAISPIMVFYSRYYIMEVPMVFWVTVAMIAAWRYAKSPGFGWAILFGVAGGITHATKETGAISFFAMAVAAALVWGAHRESLATGGKHWKHFGASLGCGLLVSMAMFSVGFREPQAMLDSIRTYFLYFERAEGSGHEKPWHYYWKVLAYNRQPEGGPIWSEALTLGFGLVGTVVAFSPAVSRFGERLFWRWIAGYTLVTALIYSVIPYKTPWSMLCWVFTLMLLAGLGVAYLASLRRPKHVVSILTLAVFAVGLWNLSVQTKNSLTRFRADYRNPFVYSHTPAKLIDLVRNVHDMAKVHPEGKAMQIAICDPDIAWPLPWYFRQFPNLGMAPSIPDSQEVLRSQDVIIVAPEYDAALMEAVGETHQFETLYGIRDDVKIYNYVENDLYERFLESRG